MAVTIIRKLSIRVTIPRAELVIEAQSLEQILNRQCLPQKWPFPLSVDKHLWNPKSFKCIRCGTPTPLEERKEVLAASPPSRRIRGSAS